MGAHAGVVCSSGDASGCARSAVSDIVPSICMTWPKNDAVSGLCQVPTAWQGTRCGAKGGFVVQALSGFKWLSRHTRP